MVTVGNLSFRKRPLGRAADGGRPVSVLLGMLLLVLLVVISSASLAGALEGRWIEVEGTSNFRDMGGWAAGVGTVKNGVLFRSDDLSDISAGGVDDLRKLGIRTIVDLRAGSGDLSRIEGLFDGKVTVVRLPMHVDPLNDKNDYYKRMVVNSRESLIGLLVLLSDKQNLPAVIFDEDGINEVDVAAQFILLTLGVKGPDVVSDYLLSNERGGSLKREWGEIIVRYFEEYGGTDYYTTKILGLSSDQIGRIRENLIIQ
ncbi:MAG: tyrosine-protein phosphatase [Deltaproteobacteria bacterium]|nr:tyrosine-protein phosphatase [Candidatus Zymogenaceae bacterium]